MKAGGVPRSPAFWERGGHGAHELQLPADTGGIRSDTDWYFSDKTDVFQVFPTETSSKILGKATFFSLKASSFVQKNPPIPTEFFYTKNNTRIEKSCYNGKTFSQLS